MNFLDELIAEAEVKQEEQTEAWFDLLLLQIQQLQNQIAYNFNEAEKECSMINGFIIHKNAQLQERMRWLEIKLEAFIRERKEKTIDLAHGTLKLHKKPDKVEISDMELLSNMQSQKCSQSFPNLLSPT